MSTRPLSLEELRSGMRRDYFESRSMWVEAREATANGERLFYQMQERIRG